MGFKGIFTGLVACCLLAAAAGATDQAPACMSGVRCGNMCAPLGGACINKQCYDSLGYPALCYAPMASTFGGNPADFNSGPSWWQPASFFPSFFPLRPFQPFMAPMQPIQPFEMFPDMLDCGGNGPCPSGAFCDPSGQCREDTCENQFQFGCPKDTGSLQKVNCIHNSGFKSCYESSTGGFKCYKGPAGGAVSCASNGYSSTSASMSSSWDGTVPANNGAASTASGTARSSGSASGAAAGTTVGADSDSSSSSSTGHASTKAGTEAPAAAAKSGAVSTAAVNGQQQQVTRQKGKVAKGSAAAAATATEVPANKGKRTFIQNGVSSNQQVAVSPDGKTVTVTNMANDGSTGASGTASGDQQYVTTNVIPGGSSVTSMSVSGNNGGPAGAVASAGSSSTGAQPLYTPNFAGK